MPSISALIHTSNDERRLGRTLETLRPCDEIVIVDHASSDGTARVARDYGAKVIKAVSGVENGAYAHDCKHDWILCLSPNESLSEALEASLLEWKSNPEVDAAGFGVRVRTQSQDGNSFTPELRLVNRTKINWQDSPPAMAPDTKILDGDLLRFEDTEV
jgi:glycosyltransferase involved in cell wall biosynthesis